MALKKERKALQSGLDEGMEAFNKFVAEHNETNKNLNHRVVGLETEVEDLYDNLNKKDVRIEELEAQVPDENYYSEGRD